MINLLKLGIPNNSKFYIGLLLSLLQGISAIALLATSAWLISRASEQPPVMYLMIAVVGVRGFALGRSVFRYGERVLLHDSAFRMMADLRPRIFSTLIPFSPAGLGEGRYGEKIARIVNDVDELQNFPLRVVSPMVQSIGASILTVLGLAILVPEGAVILALALIAAFLIAIPLSGWIGSKSESSRAPIGAHLSANTVEMLENHDVLLAYGWLPDRQAEIQTLESKLSSISKKSALSAGVGQAIFSLLMTVATIGVTWVGAKSVIDGSQPGVLLALFALLPLAVFDVAASAQPVASAMQRFITSAQRVSELINRPLSKVISPDSGEKTMDEFKSIEFKNVALGYPGSDPVVSNFSIQIKAGESICLQGPSGSGKSTVALAIARFLSPQAGQIVINGINADYFSTDSWRSTIGYVEQNPTIFLGTVRANLLLAKPTATDLEMQAVLTKVGLETTFGNREGLETELGERGVFISGGEAQRLALARALLADFCVLILDEPTANVDAMSAEQLVRDLLGAAKSDGQRTVILITHDSTLGALADRVVKL